MKRTWMPHLEDQGILSISEEPIDVRDMLELRVKYAKLANP